MDYNIILADLPTTVHAFVKHDPDFDTIVLNARMSRDGQIKHLLHEIKHLERGDFDRDDADIVEGEMLC